MVKFLKFYILLKLVETVRQPSGKSSYVLNFSLVE